MKIDFNLVPETVIHNFRGGAQDTIAQMVTDSLSKVMRLRLVPGASIGMHTHETSSEMIYVISGVGTMLCDGEYETLEPGNAHYCPKGHSHSFMNRGTEDLVFFAVVPEQ